MARIRTIKPEFWSDETVGECSPTARLLFIGTWNLADDHGNLQRSSKQIKAQLFPYDNIECEPLIRELLTADLLIEYEVEGKKYLHIKGFDKHQKVEKKSAPRYPVYQQSARTPRVLPELSPTSSGSSSGREGNGTGRERRQEGGLLTQPASGADIEAVKAIYPKRAGSEDWSTARKKLAAVLRSGVTIQDVIEGVRRYQEFCRATRKIGTETVMQAKRFIGSEERYYEKPWDLPLTSGQVRQNHNIDASLQWLQQQELTDASH